MKRAIYWVGTIASSFVVGVNGAIAADACRRAPMEMPSTKSRQITITDGQFSFNIPQGFFIKTENLENSSSLAIVVSSPRDVAFLDCTKRNRVIGAGHGTEPIVIQILPMDDIMLAPDRTGGEYERKTIKVAGSSAILARSRVPQGYPSPGDEIITVVFSNQQKYRIQIQMNMFDIDARKYNEAVLNQIISSFSFSDATQSVNTSSGQNLSKNQSILSGTQGANDRSAQNNPDQSQLLPGEAEAIRKFQATIRDFETSQKSIYVRDRRTEQEKNEISSFVTSWSKQNPKLAKFLGVWGGYEDQILIYPSVNSEKVCILTTNETGTVLIGTGQSQGSRVLWTAPSFSFRGKFYPSRQNLLVREQRYLGAFLIENQQVKTNESFDFPYSSPRPLQSLNQVIRNTDSDRSAIVQKFEDEGCMAGRPEGPIADSRSKDENGSDTYPSASTIKAALENARAERKKCLGPNLRGRSCLPSIDDIPKTDQTIKNAWAKVDPQVARFLGSWYVDVEFLPKIYPSTVKGQVCVITGGDAIVFGIGRVTGKSLRYQDKIAYDMDGYHDRSSETPHELNFFGNPGLLAFHMSNRSNPVSLAILKSSEMKSLDEWENQFRKQFNEAGCTTGLPEGSIAQPTTPLQPIAAASTYAYPSPSEFAQFKKGVALLR